MYNNIGLKTVRGSGTNGYIQTNLAKLPANWNRFRGRRRGEHPEAKKNRIFKPDPKLIEHNTKRAIEVKVFEFRSKLEDQDFGDDDIEDKVESYRNVLKAQLEAGTFIVEDPKKQRAKHEDAMDRMKKNLTMKKALGIGEDHVHGRAFDQDLQESERRERIQRREAEMTLEEKLSNYNKNYLDRLDERGDRESTLASRRERQQMVKRTRFSRSRSSSRGTKRRRSPEAREPPRKRDLSQSRERAERPRKRERERDREHKREREREPRPEKIERWNPDDDEKPRSKSKKSSKSERKSKSKSKHKSKKKKKSKRRRKKPESSSSDEAQTVRDQKKREERKRRALKHKKENESSDNSGSDDMSC